MNTENLSNAETKEFAGSATYSPEDNKLRLYIGRGTAGGVLKLRAEGWQTLHKQREAGGGDFAAVWTPARRDTALEYAGIIEDEDMGPAERAADRAERFGDYRDKRTREATGHADRFDAGPGAHGFQSQARAERAAARHDRIAGHAVDAWSKAEYWQRRTAGVIGHALHKSAPGVRMGRIKTIEAELRRDEKTNSECAAKFETWRKVSKMTDAEKQTEIAERIAGEGYGFQKYIHPRTGKEGSLWDFLRADASDRITGAEAAALYTAKHRDPLKPEFNETSLAEWINHHKLRLAYENQMLEAQGGRAAFVEMVPGGWIGKHQIRKVNKSPATGRVVSVTLKIPGDRWGNTQTGFHFRAFNIERLSTDAYRPPTEEDKASLKETKAAEKAAAPKKAPCPLINPTDADAERLQAIWNDSARAERDARVKRDGYGEAFKPAEVLRITQAQYSANSKGSYAKAETRGLCALGELRDRDSNLYSSARAEREKRIGPIVCQVRVTMYGGGWYTPCRVIVITDKPQKHFPAAMWLENSQSPIADSQAATINA